MSFRPRRGKQMSLMIPPTPQPLDETDSEEEEEAENDEAENVEEEEEETETGGREEEEESASSESEVASPKRTHEEAEEDHTNAHDEMQLQLLRQQQIKRQRLQQQLQRQKQQQDNDEEDDDEEEDDESGQEEEGQDDVQEDDSDEQEEDFRPPPTPRVTQDKLRETDREREVTPLNIREPQEVSKLYTELIDVCHNLEADTGFDENFQDVMSKNIKSGHALFEHLMKGSMGPSTSDDYDGDGAKRTIGGPGDMYLAFLHTKISSNIIRNRAERIGSGASIFSVEGYMDSLRREFVDDDGYYNPKLAAANIAMQTSVGTKTIMPLVAVVGTFDRDAVIVPKAKKPRAPLRRTNVEEQQDNVADDNPDNMQLVPQNPGAENLAKEMNKILKNSYRQHPEPVNLYEFVLDRTSFPKTVENIFYLSFLVKDGHVSLAKEENGKFKDLSLNIKPEKSQKLQTSSPDEGETSRNQTHRQKYILSFSPRMWKTMCNMSEGQDVISFYQQLMGGHRGQAAHPQSNNPPLQAIKYTN